MNLGAHGYLTIRSEAQKSVLAGLRGRGWLRLFKKLGLEKRLNGDQRLEEGASLNLFHPNTVKARDRSGTTEGTA